MSVRGRPLSISVAHQSAAGARGRGKPVPFDALALHAIHDELGACVGEGRVQKAHFVDEHSLGLEIYARGTRRWLLIDTGPETARVHFTSEPLRRGTAQTTPF